MSDLGSEGGNEIIVSFDGSSYELSRLFVEGMKDAALGINPINPTPTIVDNGVEITVQDEYLDGYSFASDIENHFGDDENRRLLIVVREKDKAFESDCLFQLMAINNTMAEAIYRAFNRHFLDFHISYQQFDYKNKKNWV